LSDQGDKKERLAIVKSFKWVLPLLLLMGVAGIGNAWADHGHVRFGVVVDPYPYWGPYYAPRPYYYPSVVIEREAPPVYIEQQAVPMAESPAAAPVNYWYYCATAKAYYPYVKECPGGWQQVLPQPPTRP